MFKISKFNFNHSGILTGLSEDELTWIRKNSTERRIRKSVELFAEGNVPREVFFLIKGKVKIFQTAESGNEQIIYIYTQGDAFGYQPLICNERNPTSASCIEDAIFTVIPANKFKELLSASPRLANLLLRNLSHEFSVWINLITSFAQYSVKERLALCLLILQEKYRITASTPIEIGLTRKDLASFTGTSIETLARMLSKWKSDGVIRTRGRKILIKDQPFLMQLVDW